MPPDADGHGAPGRLVDEAIARAAWLSFSGDVAGGVRLIAAALAAAPPGNAGWLAPIDPLLGIRYARETWTPILSMLRTRAS